MTEPTCPFCTLPHARILGENVHAVWIQDGFPVSPGHSLVIPKRHLASFFDATNEERLALLQLLDRAKAAAEAKFHPDGYNKTCSRLCRFARCSRKNRLGAAT
jgi:diadenosine tetraphosphate (Ap4A) HIT family hydrolase